MPASPATATVDFSCFNAQMGRYVYELGFAGQDVVRKQTQLLVKDLVRFSPPKNLQAAKKKLADRVEKRFAAVSNPERVYVNQYGGKHGRGDVNWYYFGPHYLQGVARDSDMTKATPEALRPLFYRITKRGQIRGRRGKQSVRIWQKILTSAKARRGLAKMLGDRYGLLRASWAIAWDRLGITGKPPQWVYKHVQSGKARGVFIPQLDKKGNPNVTMISNASGVSKGASVRTIQTSVNRRAEAMRRDVALYLKGIKKKAGFN